MKIGVITGHGLCFGGYQGVMSVSYIDIKSGQESYRYSKYCGWAHTSKEQVETSKTIQWTHSDRLIMLGEAQWELIELMNDAKVSDTRDLIGTPVKFLETSGVVRNISVLKEALL